MWWVVANIKTIYHTASFHTCKTLQLLITGSQPVWNFWSTRIRSRWHLIKKGLGLPFDSLSSDIICKYFIVLPMQIILNAHNGWLTNRRLTGLTPRLLGWTRSEAPLENLYDRALFTVFVTIYNFNEKIGSHRGSNPFSATLQTRAPLVHTYTATSGSYQIVLARDCTQQGSNIYSALCL